MKNNTLLALALIILSFGCSATTISAPNGWQTYSNKECGYEVQYPPNSRVVSGPDLRHGFYLNPIQFIDNLKNDEQFKDIVLINNCMTKIYLPIQPNTTLYAKYVILLVIKNVPKQWPPPFATKGDLVTVGNKQFYRIHDVDSAMCHQYDHYYYFFKKNNNYYVLIFLFTAHCLDEKNNETEYNQTLESKDFDSILSSFKIL